jgi:hypothetical protein
VGIAFVFPALTGNTATSPAAPMIDYGS